MTTAHSEGRRSPASGDRDTYHHGDLRSELVRLGLEAIEAVGAEELSLRSLAERAGVSKTAPYRHFADKEAFLAALADEGYRLLLEALRGPGESSEGGVAGMGRAYLAFARERPGLYRLMTSPILGVGGPLDPGAPEPGPLPPPVPGDGRWPRRALLYLSGVLARESSGRRGPRRPDPSAAAAAWAYVHGLAMIRIDGLFPPYFGEPDWDYLAGLTPRLPDLR